MKRTMLASILVLALVAMITVGSTLAYLTDRDAEKVSYEIGKIVVDIEEPGWQTEDGKFTDGDDPKGMLYPTRTFIKNPLVVVKGGSENCFVRINVTVGPNLALAIEELVATANWEIVSHLKDGSGNDTYVFVYLNEVPSSAIDQKTPSAFEKVTVKADPPLPAGMEKHEELLEAAGKETIEVVGEAIQSAGFDNAKAAFAALDAQ